MSNVNVDINSSGFVGVSADKPINNVESIKSYTESKNEFSHKEAANISPEEVTQAVDEMNDFLGSINRNLSFSFDEDSGDSIITIKDSESDEVIRQIPSEELLVLRKKMDYVVGILFDEKV